MDKTRKFDLVDTIFHSSPIIVFFKDKNNRILRVNQAGANYMKMKIEDIENKHSKEFFPEFYEKYHKDDLEVIHSGKPKLNIVEIMQSANNEKRWVRTDKVPYRDDNGKIIGVVVFVVDITNEKEMEQQLHQAEKMQALGLLAGGIAHDFNNQLAGIRNFSELIKMRSKEKPEIAHFSDNIIKMVEHSASLTRQLLAFSRKGKYQMVKFDLHKIVSEVASILKYGVDKRIKIKSDFSASQFYTSGDPSQIQNAVLNLGLNARDAMGSSGDIQFNTENTTLSSSEIKQMRVSLEPGEYILLSVVDKGIGMTDETQKRIFEPFFTTKERGKGTGMGLAAVAGTIENHRGAVLAESKVGEGSVFKVFLPVAKPSISSETKSLEARKAKKTGHILFVEDEKMIAEAATLVLQEHGHQVTVRHDGQSAMNVYEESWKKFDLVILDMVMPEMNGKEAFIKMKEINPSVKAIMLSGYSVDEELQEVLKLGLKGYVEKPYSQNDLIQKIEDVLHG